MKKYSTLFLIASVLLIILSGNVVFNSWYAHAVETNNDLSPTSLPSESTLMIKKESTDGAVIQKKSEYTLPYPGILPDHPLYFLKDFRDKIIEMLVVDPERKSEFYLLQSDKYLSAVQSLLDKNQTDKAKLVLSQSSEKMSMAVAQLSIVKTNGKQVPAGSIDRLSKSIEKHLEIVQEVSSKIDVTEATSALQKAEEEVTKLK